MGLPGGMDDRLECRADAEQQKQDHQPGCGLELGVEVLADPPASEDRDAHLQPERRD